VKRAVKVERVERAEPRSIAVVGAGVAGCALVAQLRRLGCRAPITLLETGRGAGGRAATRRSRRDDALAIDHGAPLFNLSAEPPPELLVPLRQGGWIGLWPPGPAGLATLEAGGRIAAGSGDGRLAGEIQAGRRGMESLAGGLLELAAEATPVGVAGPQVRYGVMVRELVPSPSGSWRLLDAQGQLLAEADWLVLAGTLLAHPRGPQVFGWSEVPLAAAARQLGDPRLEAALQSIAALRSEARSNLLLVIAAAAARPWLSLPFRHLSFTPDAQDRWGLERLSMQPLADGRVVVVAHSSAAVADRYLGIHGRRSSAGRLLDAPKDPGAEQRLIQALSEALSASLVPVLPEDWSLAGVEQCQLMRWGAAFPCAPGLDAESMVCPDSRVALCGDAIAGPGFGRIEGALRSGEWLAARLLQVAADS
jgi:predicted NAD/FAD-dependent oxidoreductase